MRHKDKRALAWMVSVILFFPLWIGAMYAIDTLLVLAENGGRVALPVWLKSGLYFMTIPAVLLPVSIGIARWMDARSPLISAGSASWDQQGNESAARRH